MADGDLVYGLFECRRTDLSVVLDLVEGRWAIPEIRGVDSVVVGRPGRFVVAKVRDRLPLSLSGWVRGLGDTETERWESFHVSMSALADAFQLNSTSTLTISDPYMGLPSGESEELNARTVSVAHGNIFSAAMVKVDIELECVDDPPVWQPV